MQYCCSKGVCADHMLLVLKAFAFKDVPSFHLAVVDVAVGLPIISNPVMTEGHDARVGFHLLARGEGFIQCENAFCLLARELSFGYPLIGLRQVDNGLMQLLQRGTDHEDPIQKQAEQQKAEQSEFGLFKSGNTIFLLLLVLGNNMIHPHKETRLIGKNGLNGQPEVRSLSRGRG